MAISHSVKPLPLGGAVVWFALSAIPFWLGLYLVLPLLVDSGTGIAAALCVAFLVPLSLLLLFSILVGRRESKGKGWTELRKRWRLESIKLSDLGWALLLLVVSLAGYLGLAGTAEWLQQNAGLVPPEALDLVQTPTTFFGFELLGNWWVLALHFGILLLNVLGEELWFRGILFPRQEAEHGKKAWLVHGLCYHAFHMFYPWGVLRLLPESLMYGWIAQRSGSSWPSVISHFLFNGLALIATISGILG